MFQYKESLNPRQGFRLARPLLLVFSFCNCLRALNTCFISLKVVCVPKIIYYVHVLTRERSILPKYHYSLEFGGERSTYNLRPQRDLFC